MKILDITENEDGSCDVGFELTKEEVERLTGHVVEQALINYITQENDMNEISDGWQDRASYEAEIVRYREALKEIVEHGESDCYVIALHALEQDDDS